MTPVRLEPVALRSRVKHSTTEPLRSMNVHVKLFQRPVVQEMLLKYIFNFRSGGNFVQPCRTINLCNFGREHYEKHSCEIFWTSGSRLDVVLKNPI